MKLTYIKFAPLWSRILYTCFYENGKGLTIKIEGESLHLKMGWGGVGSSHLYVLFKKGRFHRAYCQIYDNHEGSGQETTVEEAEIKKWKHYMAKMHWAAWWRIRVHWQLLRARWMLNAVTF